MGSTAKRAGVEQRYVVSAKAFVLAPEVLDDLDATAGEQSADKASAS